ncbi:hypothetical protein BCR35DRAFT_309773, partial [Leucosporidium creatinivorum]
MHFKRSTPSQAEASSSATPSTVLVSSTPSLPSLRFSRLSLKTVVSVCRKGPGKLIKQREKRSVSNIITRDSLEVPKQDCVPSKRISCLEVVMPHPRLSSPAKEEEEELVFDVPPIASLLTPPDSPIDAVLEQLEQVEVIQRATEEQRREESLDEEELESKVGLGVEEQVNSEHVETDDESTASTIWPSSSPHPSPLFDSSRRLDSPWSSSESLPIPQATEHDPIAKLLFPSSSLPLPPPPSSHFSHSNLFNRTTKTSSLASVGLALPIDLRPIAELDFGPIVHPRLIRHMRNQSLMSTCFSPPHHLPRRSPRFLPLDLGAPSLFLLRLPSSHVHLTVPVDITRLRYTIYHPSTRVGRPKRAAMDLASAFDERAREWARVGGSRRSLRWRRSN